MSISITECFFFPVRHPERSEAKDFLFSQPPRPSAVEGPSRFDSKIALMNSFLYARRPLCGLSVTTPSGPPAAAFMPHRSFDCGSARRDDEPHLPFAFAQDDGALVFSLVPKLYLGTHLSAQFHCPTVARRSTATN
jgi:hypothetical protein